MVFKCLVHFEYSIIVESVTGICDKNELHWKWLWDFVYLLSWLKHKWGCRVKIVVKWCSVLHRKAFVFIR